MQKTIICKSCGKQKPANIRLKGTQKYCGDRACQRARKALWQRQKKAQHHDYCSRQNGCHERWCENKPIDQYMSQYRRDNPEYVASNREQQKIRNQKRRAKAAAEKIVKMDALQNQPEKSSSYTMTTYKVDASKKIVKMDTLLVELKAFQGDRQTFFSNFP